MKLKLIFQLILILIILSILVIFYISFFKKNEKEITINSEKPEKIIERAVWGMLPKNRLGRATIKKLHIYSTDKHPHVAQNPVELNFDIKKVEE